MPKQREELKRQDSFTCRIPNDVDDGFLQWLNKVRRQKKVFQRTVIEAMHLFYAEEMSVPGKWIPLPPELGVSIDRNVLQWMAQAGTVQVPQGHVGGMPEKPRQAFVPEDTEDKQDVPGHGTNSMLKEDQPVGERLGNSLTSLFE